jgi:hypothetical protein
VFGGIEGGITSVNYSYISGLANSISSQVNTADGYVADNVEQVNDSNAESDDYTEKTQVNNADVDYSYGVQTSNYGDANAYEGESYNTQINDIGAVSVNGDVVTENVGDTYGKDQAESEQANLVSTGYVESVYTGNYGSTTSKKDALASQVSLVEANYVDGVVEQVNDAAVESVRDLAAAEQVNQVVAGEVEDTTTQDNIVYVEGEEAVAVQGNLSFTGESEDVLQLNDAEVNAEAYGVYNTAVAVTEQVNYQEADMSDDVVQDNGSYVTSDGDAIVTQENASFNSEKVADVEQGNVAEVDADGAVSGMQANTVFAADAGTVTQTNFFVIY